MGIEMDVWFSERKELREEGKIDEIMNFLKAKDMAYEKEGALWFRATKFGDNEDRVIVRQNGEPTYFGVDCAYHKNKFLERKFDRVINVWGADHHGDVPRLKGFVEFLGFKEKFEIFFFDKSYYYPWNCDWSMYSYPNIVGFRWIRKSNFR